MERYGIDVSHHQGAIDWAKVKSAKIQALDKTTHPVEFALIRAGISYWTGGLKRDEQFDRNMAQAAQQGIPVGVYVYSYTKTPDAIRGTANAVLDAVKDYGKDVPIILDLEDAEVYAPLGKAKTTAIAQAFVDRVRAAMRPVILYTYTAFAQAYVDLSAVDCPKWIADYRGYCGVQNPDIWQFFNKGRVDGISGNADLNVSYTDKCPLVPPPAEKITYYGLRVYGFSDQAALTKKRDGFRAIGLWCDIYQTARKNYTEYGLLFHDFSRLERAMLVKSFLKAYYGWYSDDPHVTKIE